MGQLVDRVRPGWARLARLGGILAGLAAAAALQVGGAHPAYAATYTWTGASLMTSNWSDAANWGGAAPSNNETNVVLVFDGLARLANTNDVSGLQISSITFNSNGFAISGNGVTLAGGLTDSATGGTNTWSLATTLSGATTVSTADAETLVLGGTVGGAGSLAFTGTGTANMQDAGPTGSLTLGSGTLRTGASLNTSALNLNGGTLAPTPAASYSAPVVLGGSVVVGGSSNIIFTGSISGAGPISFANSATVTLSGPASYSGSTTLSSGTLQTPVAGALSFNSPLTISGGTLDLGASVQAIPSLDGAGGTVSLTGMTSVLSFTGLGTAVYVGTIAGAGGVAETGTGMQSLAGPISYTGTTIVNTGTLAVLPPAPATLGRLTLNGGTLAFAGDQSITVTGPIDGPGTLTDLDTASLTIVASGGAFSGDLNINSGGVLMLGADWSTGPLTMSAGSLSLTSFSLSVPVLGGNGSVDLGSGTLTVGTMLTIDSEFSGTITGSGALTKVFNSQLTLLGSLSYTGLTTVSAGPLTVAPSSGPVTLSGGFNLTAGTLTLGGTQAINLGGAIDGSGSISDLDTGVVTVTPSGGSYDGHLTVGIASAVFRLGADWAAGSATLINGSIDLNNHAATFSSLAGAAGTTLNTSGGVLNVGSPNATTRTTFAGAITGAGSLVKFEASTLVLSGASTYTGLTTVSGGVLEVDGSLPGSGLVAVSAGGTLGGNGTVGSVTTVGAISPGLLQHAHLKCVSATFNLGSDFKVRIDTGGAGTGYDRLSCSGAVLFGAGAGAPTLTLTAAAGAVPDGVYTILHTDSPSAITPEFKNWADGTIKTVNGQVFRLGHTSKDVTLTKLGGGRYRSLTPYRVLDTRPPANQTLGPGATLDLAISPSGSGGNSVPAGASAAVLNVTAVGPSQGTFLSLYPRGSPPNPLSSNLNVGPGQTIANLVTVQLDPQGFVTILNSVGSVDVVVDVQGWFTATPDGGGDPSGLYKAPAEAPIRILDTRPGTRVGPYRNPISPDSSIDVQVSPNSLLPGMPPGSARAVVLNVTAIGPSQSTFLTVYPTDAPSRPTASNVNVAAGRNLPNRVIVRLSAFGQVTVYNSAGYVDVAIDFAGYFTATDDPTGSLFHPLTPVRAYDSRPAGTFGSGETRAIPIVGSAAPVPAVATAVVGNATAVAASAPSYLSIYPQGGSQPLVSDLNYTGGDTLPNLVLVRLGTGGQIAVYNNNGSVDFVFDVYGWFGTDPTPR